MTGTVWWVASPKGGTGCSTVAAGLAVTLASAGRAPVTLIDRTGAMRPLMGLVTTESGREPLDSATVLAQRLASESLGGYLETVGPDLDLLVVDGPLESIIDSFAEDCDVIVDAGQDPDVPCSVTKRVLVLRTCYLCLWQSQRGLWSEYTPDVLAVINNPGRTLNVRDACGVTVSHAGMRVVAAENDPRVGRAVDAGTLISRLPPPLRDLCMEIAEEGA